VGAGVVLLDIDPHTLNIDPTSVPNDLDALVAVHYAGLPIDLAAIRDRPRVIIEDAAHAIGGATPDGPVGACVHSDMCCFSFHPVKTITTAEGGAVTTNDDRLADRLRRFRNHGMRPMPEVGGWYYEIDEVGFNYRLTDMQAALGTSQLSKLDRFVDRRNELAVRYAELLARSQVLLPPDTSPGYRHGRHLYPVRVEDRDRIFHELRDAGIGVQVHFVPIHRHPAYARLGFERADFPAAEEAYRTLLSLPLFPSLTQDEQDRVVAALHRCL
jgi:dTDP-4-amino-4,6-dideoxygalactose transaminase